MGIDILLAALFLVLTAISVPALLTGANLFYELFGWRIFIWEIYLEAAERAPFSEGLAVTIMLLTTLIPTALHLLLAGAALAVVLKRTCRPPGCDKKGRWRPLGANLRFDYQRAPAPTVFLPSVFPSTDTNGGPYEHCRTRRSRCRQGRYLQV